MPRELYAHTYALRKKMIPSIQNSNHQESEQQNSALEPLPLLKQDVSSFENTFVQFDTSFDKVAAITDLVEREYELIQEAKRLEIPVESYRRMFEAAITSQKGVEHKFRFLKPFKFLDQRLGDIVSQCQNISLFRLTSVISQVTLLLALGSYLFDAPQRHQQALNQAKAQIKAQVGEKFSYDRIEALEFLVQNCEAVVGIEAPQASLPNLRLDTCNSFQITDKAFTQFPFQFSHLQPMSFAYANFAGADLQSASLQQVNLMGANLQGANLRGANLQGANLRGANLKGAYLEGANLQAADLEEANLQASLLSRANFSGANLRGAIASGATLLWSNLSGADLHTANLAGANLNRANLQGADLYRTNLQAASLRYADLRNRASLREAQIKNADLHEAKFWSISELKRAQNWQQALTGRNWQARIAHGQTLPIVALVRANTGSIFHSYQAGIETVQMAGTYTIQSKQSGVGAEAASVKELIEKGVDAILLRPEDPEASVPAIRKAYEAGVVVITIGDCINSSDAKQYVFACYESDSFHMGYDLTAFMAKSMTAKLRGKEIEVGIIDSLKLGRAYPYFKGFEQAMKDSGVPWNEAVSVDAHSESDVTQIIQMLREHPEINVLWGGTNIATENAVKAVQSLRLSNKVMVYGIEDLTHGKATMLLDSKNPLQSIVDEQPQETGRRAAETAIDILKGVPIDYQRNVISHRVLSQQDRQVTQEMLDHLVESHSPMAAKHSNN